MKSIVAILNEFLKELLNNNKILTDLILLVMICTMASINWFLGP